MILAAAFPNYFLLSGVKDKLFDDTGNGSRSYFSAKNVKQFILMNEKNQSSTPCYEVPERQPNSVWVEQCSIYHQGKGKPVVHYSISIDGEALIQVSYEKLLAIRDLINVIENGKKGGQNED